ncbi:hypothetical protein F4778DRAFT_753995 [Xylariomycetidae sp. FL2044]|nr:hypothetical protein F4778DRAFT_753995 [Xylariomycetidae sp. FL2044]
MASESGTRRGRSRRVRSLFDRTENKILKIFHRHRSKLEEAPEADGPPTPRLSSPIPTAEAERVLETTETLSHDPIPSPASSDSDTPLRDIEASTEPTHHGQKLSRLWAAAISQTPSQERDVLSQLQHHDGNLLEELVKEARSKHDEMKSKRWNINFFGKTIVIRDVVGTVLSKLEIMESLGDAVAGSFSQAALPWAAVKFLMQVSTADQEQEGQILVCVEAITIFFGRCQIYEQLYLSDAGTPSDPETRLSDTIIEIYKNLISMLARIIQILKKNVASRALQATLSPPIKDFLDTISNLEDRAEKEAANCERFHHRVLSRQQTSYQEALKSMVYERFERLQQTLDDCWKVLASDEQAATLQWISRIEYADDHAFAEDGILENSGQWLLRHETYIKWRDAPASEILWLHGIPGAGKTKLSSRVINTAISSQGEASGIAYFYCNKNRHEHRDPRSILASLVRQLAFDPRQLAVADLARREYDSEKKRGFAGQLTIPRCTKLLTDLSGLYADVYLLIDGLDETDESTRRELMEALDKVITGSKSVVKVYIASRDDRDIKEMYGERNHLRISATDNQEDIERFVVDKMERSAWCRENMTTELRAEVIGVFRTKSQGMFQWAALHIKELLGYQRERDVRTYLNALPEGLSDTYREIWRKIQAKGGSKPKIAKRAFQWLMCSLRPLKPDELVVLVSQDPDEDFCLEVDIDINYVLDACHNLITVVDSHSGQDSFCGFSHLSVQDYFQMCRFWTTADCHSLAARVCLRYWSQRHVKIWYPSEVSPLWKGDHVDIGISEVSLPLRERLQNHSLRWPEHINECQKHTDACQNTIAEAFRLLQQFLLGPLDSSAGYKNWIRWAAIQIRPLHIDFLRDGLTDQWLPFDQSLWGCVHYNLLDPIRRWLKEDVLNPNHKSPCSYSLLHFAVEAGHHELAGILISHGASVTPEISSPDGSRFLEPLLAVAINPEILSLRPTRTQRESCTKMARLLLDKGVILLQRHTQQKIMDSGFFPWEPELVSAACHNDSKLVAELVKQGADMSLKGNAGETALEIAIIGAADDIVSCLVSHGAEVDLRLGSPEDPLSLLELALSLNRTFVVKLLLSRGVPTTLTITRGGSKSRTALVYANNSKTIGLLVEHKANPSDALGREGPELNTKQRRGALITDFIDTEQTVPGWLERERILVEVYGADANHRSNIDGEVPLEAAWRLSARKSSLRLNWGVDPMKFDGSGDYRDFRRIGNLIDAGADANSSLWGQWPVMYCLIAERQFQIGCMREDISFRFSPDPDKQLTHVQNLRKEISGIVRKLLRKGADVHLCGEGGESTLDLCNEIKTRGDEELVNEIRAAAGLPPRPDDYFISSWSNLSPFPAYEKALRYHRSWQLASEEVEG